MAQPILEMKGIHKQFGSTIALGDVDLNVYPGEIRGLIGENGSGKSTISSIAAGMQKADRGEMLYHGQAWNPTSMIDALSHGIGMIVQESGTIPGITVAENLFLGETKQFKGPLGTVNRKAMNAKADEALDAIGVNNVRGGTPMGALDFQTRKLTEIAKVVMKDPEILVVDETTTALSQEGRTILYNLMKKFRDNGKAVVFISHNLEEIMEVCDTLTVLRDGSIIRHFEKSEFDADAIRTSMIGRELQGDYYRSDFTPTHLDSVALEARNINLGEILQDIDITLHKGEIVGIGGLSHCGMHPLGKILFGAVKPATGEVVTGDGTKITSEAVAMKKNIGYVSKDRDTESLTLPASIRDNIAIAGMERYAVNHFLVLNPGEKKYVDKQIENLSIKCSDRDQQVSQLSGGNKQKVVFGKWIGRGSDILILDCPTRGVDIGVKRAMYQLMMELKKEGKSILMISEEMPELMGMCDRLIIMKDGKITKEFQRSADLSDAEIIKYMI
ncbi:MAG: sugar ABC transporter ATP-binding protein [Oscillospiraceae bacterium]|nr:sugar ABC transporter ATP-binding protein [Oscillospiraceae bacterium]